MLDKMKWCPVFDDESQDVVYDHEKDWRSSTEELKAIFN